MTVIADEPAELYSAPVERIGRYFLHRAGIFNVWQYDDVELRFHGGRMLLRGKNGAGKSKAMEMLLPFLLDGDTRAIDCVKRDRTTLGWLMTAGRDAGNHLGYIWLELRHVDEDGVETFRTLGCGVKASTATARAKPWFFVTAKRVGEDLLIRDGAHPMAQEAFREQLDSDDYFTSASAYARRVAKDLFGIEDDQRYRNLCHLLYELRRPSVGESIEGGEHARVLAGALPPLDEDLVANVARNFDDLDKIRDDLHQAEKTQKAVAEFLGAYRDYTRGVIRSRAGTVVAAAQTADRELRELRRAAGRVEETRTIFEDADGVVSDLEAQERNANDEIEILQKRPAYEQAQAMEDRRARVNMAKSRAEDAKNHARIAQSNTNRDAARVTSTGQEFVRAAQKLTAARRDLEVLATGLGVDAVLFGAATDVPAAGGDDGGPLVVDGIVADEELSRYDEALGNVERAIDARLRVVQTLTAEAKNVEELQAKGAELAAQVEQAFRRLEGAEGQVSEAEVAAKAADRAWRQRLGVWLATHTVRRTGTDWSALTAYVNVDEDEETAVLDVEDFDDIHILVEDRLAPLQADAAEAHARSINAVLTADGEVNNFEIRFDEAERRTEVLPAPSTYRTASRDATIGTPFYALIDFADSVETAVAAGVEAALEASGLLDGWVHTDGTVSASEGELLLIPAEPVSGPSLADVLVVAPSPGSPVSADIVDRLLRAIGFGEQPDAKSWVAGDGRWRLGVARGQWAKPHVTFIGVGARQAARQRELAELTGQLAGARDRQRQANEGLAAVKQWVADLDAARRSVPPSTTVQKAGSDLAARRAVATAARAEHHELLGPATTAQDAAVRAERALLSNAASQDLPHERPVLEELTRGLTQLDDRAGTQRQGIETAKTVLARHVIAYGELAETVERQNEADADAARVGEEYRSEAMQLATLEDTFGDDVREILAMLATAQGELAAAVADLPEARRKRDEANVAHAVARSEHGTQQRTLRSAERHVTSAGDVLVRILHVAGIALAAFGDTVPPLAYTTEDGDDSSVQVRRVRAWASRIEDAAAGKTVSDSVILKRYEDLGPGLSAGYDAHQDETADGVKVFELHDDTGSHPVAVVAQRLTAEVGAARSRLTERQAQIFERFLHGELGDHLRRQLLDADTLVQAMNAALAGVRTSHGLGAKLEWHLREDAPNEAVEAIPLLRDGFRDTEKNEWLANLLGTLIDTARAANPTDGYEAHLRNALDYRNWHAFTIKVVDDANPGRERRLGSRLAVSQGEQRVLVYLALFSAAAAYFNSLERRAPQAPRVILLDDAFAKIDEPTHGPLLRLLVDLNLDFIITSERVTGCQPGVPSLEIYECLRDPRVRGVALVHTHWDGHRPTLVSV